MFPVSYHSGDKIRIRNVSEEQAKSAQIGYGGLTSSMLGCMGKVGIVSSVGCDGNCLVRMSDGSSTYRWNPMLLEKFEEAPQVGGSISLSNSNISVSSEKTGRPKSKILLNNASDYWESDGMISGNPHWIEIKPPSGSSYPCLQMYVQDHNSYSPKDISLYVGASSSSLLKVKDMQLSRSGGWTTLLSSSEMRSASGSSSPQVLKIEIRSNHEDGCDSRVSGVRLLSDSEYVEVSAFVLN